MDWNGNKNSIYKIIGASNHTDNERESDDYYATDPIAIDKLLQHERLSPIVWECACGEGHLSQRLKDYGYIVQSSDIVHRGYPGTKVVDFLQVDKPFIGDIITNPPYKYGKEFVLKALELVKPGRKVYMFLKLTFLEGKARYKELYACSPPRSIYVFSERVLCAKNAEFKRMRDGGGSAVCYAWFVWEKGYKGMPTIAWL